MPVFHAKEKAASNPATFISPIINRKDLPKFADGLS
jgi:hypothetical protein